MNQRIFNRTFIFLFLAQFCFSFVFCVLLPTIPIYLSRLDATEAEIGVLVGILSVAALICRPLVGRGLLHIPEKHFMIAGSIIFALYSVAYLMARPLGRLTSCLSLCYSQLVLSKRSVAKNANLRISL